MTLRTPNYALRYPELTDTPNGPAQVEALAEDVDVALLSTNTTAAGLAATVAGLGVMTPYTPTITMATPTGTPSGRYATIGKLVVAQAGFVGTAGVSLGTGNISFTVPFASANTGFNWQGQVFINSGTGIPYVLPCTVGPNSSTVSIFAFLNSNRGSLDTPGNQGVVFAAGGFLSAWIVYEKA